MGIPVQAFFLAAAVVNTTLLLKKFRMGRRIFATRNNEKASHYAGIDTIKMLFGAYILYDVLACLAGNIQVGRVFTARADMGSTYLMECISAVVLGGTSIAGSRLVGVLIFTLISNIMNLVGISAFWQQFTTGTVLRMVVSFNRVTENSQRKRRAGLLKIQDE